MRVSMLRLAALICVASAMPHGADLSQAPQGAVAAPRDTASSASGNQPFRIDTVVSDRQGRPILGLRPADFEVIEDGASRPFTAVEVRSEPGPAAVVPVDTEGAIARVAATPGTRVFAFVLDEFHVGAGENADRSREAVSRFIDEQVGPRDLAAVIRPLDAVTNIRFTTDRTVLHAALAEFAGRKGDLTPRSRFEEEYIGRAPAAVAAARTQILTASLRELTLRLGDLQADRGVMVLVSEGFPRDAGPRARLQDLQGVVRASSRFHLAIYTFNPSARNDAPSADASGVATLEWLAAQTGGRAVGAGGDLGAGFDRMARDLAAYYAISYPPAQEDGRFHSVEIRIKRRNVDVRARPGYWASLGSEWRALVSTANVPRLSMRALRRSAFVETWIGLATDSAGQVRMVISWEPRSGTSKPRAVAVRARTSAGAELFAGQVAAVQGGAGAQPDSARFDVPAGRVELDLSVLDVAGKVLDTEVRDFDVPDLRAQKRGPMLLFPEVVRARTLRDFRTILSDPDAAPSSGRVFARGDRLLIRVPAYDPSGVAVQVSATILNEWGGRMRAIDSAQPAAGNIAQFVLPLSWLGAGQYLIELAGSNANGAVKERLAFRVSG